MPIESQIIQFKYGQQSGFNSIAQKDTNTVYFVTDTQRLFVGDVEYTRPVQSGTELPSGYLPPNSLFVKTTGGVRDLYYSANGTAWTMIAHLPAEITGGVFGNNAGGSVGFGGTITVPKVTVDTHGSVTAIEDVSITLPEAPEDAEIAVTQSGSGNVVTSVVETPGTTTGITVTKATLEGSGSVTGGATTFVTGVTLGSDFELTGTTQAADTDVSTGSTIPTTAAVKQYVDTAIGNVTDFDIDSNGGSGYASLAALQEAHDTGEKGVFYLVVNPDAESNNAFIEYFWTGKSYELAGQFGSVNTADFVTTEQLTTQLGNKVDKVSGTSGNLVEFAADGAIADSEISSDNVAVKGTVDSGYVMFGTTSNPQQRLNLSPSSITSSAFTARFNSTVTTNTPSDNLTDGALVIGSGGAKAVTSLANGSNGQVLSVSASGLKWTTPTTYTFANGSDGSFTVTPSGGEDQKVSIGTPANATNAVNATNDANGNPIATTYATKTELQAAALTWGTF